MSYFNKFPLTKRNDGNSVVDITRKGKLKVSNSGTAYLPYTVKEGEKPEDVAFYYYGDPELAWLVLSVNDIVDPYTHWPKTQSAFDDYIMKQYEAQSGVTGRAVIEWTQNKTINTNIKWYESKYNQNVRINHKTFSASPQPDPAFNANEWAPIRIYDYEFRLNEERRQIQLFNLAYMGEIANLLERRLNGK
jgi:hypothetical protein